MVTLWCTILGELRLEVPKQFQRLIALKHSSHVRRNLCHLCVFWVVPIFRRDHFELGSRSVCHIPCKLLGAVLIKYM